MRNHCIWLEISCSAYMINRQITQQSSVQTIFTIVITMVNYDVKIMNERKKCHFFKYFFKLAEERTPLAFLIFYF